MPVSDADFADGSTVAASRRDAGLGSRRGRAEGDSVLKPGDFVGRFEVVSLLGRGGMGAVYLADDPELDRRLAIKLVRRHEPGSVGEAATARLQREAQAMAKVTHSNIVTVYDVGRYLEQLFISMEYVPGGTLRRWLGERTRTLPEILAMFCSAGRGLAAAHAVGVVHRDFKPDNILVSSEGDAKVVDFGLAVDGIPIDAVEDADVEGDTGVMRTRLTSTGAVVGTPAYMAPEQHEARPTDARTDQFAFAVALYEALYGKRPFAGSSMTALVESVMAGRIQPVDRGEVPEAVHEVIVRAMSTEPDDRFADMETMLDALSRGTERRPRRRRLLGVVGVVAVAGVGTWGWLRDPEAVAGAAADDLSAECEFSLPDGWDALTDRERATHIFEVGSTAYAEADYAKATGCYQRSWTLAPEPELLFNLGMTLQRWAEVTEGEERRDLLLRAKAEFERYKNTIEVGEPTERVDDMLGKVESQLGLGLGR